MIVTEDICDQLTDELSQYAALYLVGGSSNKEKLNISLFRFVRFAARRNTNQRWTQIRIPQGF